MVILFHLLVDGGKIPPYLCRWNFPPLADGGIFPPVCIWWKNSTLLVGIFPPSASRWKFFPPSASRWENSTKKGGCGMVEFFHPCIDGGKIPPYRWRFWTTFIGGIFHHIRLQCIAYLTTLAAFSLNTHACFHPRGKVSFC